MGLGSIVGTGVFVSVGIAAEITGPAVVLAIALAAVVAACNALSSAQLAANHPISGGTYEYGYRYLNPWLGFTAGWTFLCAKSASAATAALGFSGYLVAAAGGAPSLLVPMAAGTVVILTALVLTGVRLSSRVNVAFVTISLLSLLCFCAAGAPVAWSAGQRNLSPFFYPSDDAGAAAGNLLHATALMFVAFTGYGRIATLGEEVRDPRRTIPRAIVATLAVTSLLYIAVGAVLVSTVGAEANAGRASAAVASLESAASRFPFPGTRWIVTLGAITAMLGVSLNLVLGLSRVLLAMGRRGDMPSAVSRLDHTGSTPSLAVSLTGAAVAGLVLIGDVKATWSFSAFSVLVYYAITNSAALCLPREQRLYSPAVAWCGLAACLFLAFQVERQFWLTGLGLIAGGLVWHAVAAAIARRSPPV